MSYDLLVQIAPKKNDSMPVQHDPLTFVPNLERTGKPIET